MAAAVRRPPARLTGPGRQAASAVGSGAQLRDRPLTRWPVSPAAARRITSAWSGSRLATLNARSLTRSEGVAATEPGPPASASAAPSAPARFCPTGSPMTALSTNHGRVRDDRRRGVVSPRHAAVVETPHSRVTRRASRQTLGPTSRHMMSSLRCPRAKFSLAGPARQTGQAASGRCCRSALEPVLYSSSMRSSNASKSPRWRALGLTTRKRKKGATSSSRSKTTSERERPLAVTSLLLTVGIVQGWLS